jgi:outer membrane protein TolC
MLCPTANAQRSMTIAQLFDLVEQGNPSLQANLTGEKAAQEGVAHAKSQRLPDLNTSLSMSYVGNALMTNRHLGDVHGLKSPHLGNNFALEAQQTIYAGGAIQTGIRKAELASEQAKASTSQTREEQRFMALGLYLELEKIDLRLQVVDSNIVLTQKLIDQIKEKHLQGVALKNDVTRYELQMQTLRLNRKELEDQRSISNHQLCNALGLEPEERILPADHVSEQTFAREPETDWQQRVVTSSPTLRLSQLSAQQAKEDERLARSEMLPKVAIVAADHFDGPITYELPPIDKNINAWYVGIGVSYPLSGLFKSNKKLRQARLITEQKKQETLVANEQLNNAMQQAHTLYEQAYVELQTQQKKVQLANENYEVMNDRYLNQLALVTDMVDASNLKLDAELQEVDARIQIAFAYYKMQYLAGTL